MVIVNIVVSIYLGFVCANGTGGSELETPPKSLLRLSVFTVLVLQKIVVACYLLYPSYRFVKIN